MQPTLDVQFAPFNGLTVAIAGGASDYVFAGPVAMNGSGGFLPALGVTAGIVAYTP